MTAEADAVHARLAGEGLNVDLDTIDRVLAAAAAVAPCPDQPVSHVRWVPRTALHANGYNPNHVAPPEMRLLALSILEDGWTQPIVTREDPAGFEIIDGFHRWTVGGYPEVAKRTGGLVPVVTAAPDPAQQRMATIRHNRARGTHGVRPMADIVAELLDMGLSLEEVGRRVGMEREEVTRLRERGNMIERGRAETMGRAWRPAERAES